LSRPEEFAAKWQGDDLVLRVRVQPRASCNEILGVSNARLKIRTTAAPTDGKANKAVIRLLATYLHVPPSRIDVTHGQASRDKQIIARGPVSLPQQLHIAMQASNSL
jgi:uncharacterized protein (TIGR00251 family)